MQKEGLLVNVGNAFMHSKPDLTRFYRNLQRFGTDKSVPYGKTGFVLQFQAFAVIASLRQQAWRSLKTAVVP